MEACEALLPLAEEACQQRDRSGCQLLRALQRRILQGEEGAYQDRGPGRGKGHGGPSAGYDENQPLPCRFQAGATSMISGNLPLVPCARLIAGSGGRGMWGQNQIQVDRNSMIYINGRQHGVATNESGSVGTLEQRCLQGSVEACREYERGIQKGIQGMDRLYPRGWNQ